MRILNTVTCGDDFTNAATISDVIHSNGGYFVVTANDVYMAVQYTTSAQGQTAWTLPVHVPIGNGYIEKGTTGIRFHNYVAGANAVVSAALSENVEPSIALTAGGQASTTPNLAVQHNGVLVGTEPTLDLEDAGAFVWTVTDDGANTRVKVTPPRSITGMVDVNGNVTAGVGFTALRTGAGAYTVTFAVAFAAAPIVVLTISDQGSGQGPGYIYLNTVSTTTFTVLTSNTSNVAQNRGFAFYAVSP